MHNGINSIPSTAVTNATSHTGATTTPTTTTPPLPTGTSSVPGGAVSPQHAGRGSFMRQLSSADQQTVQATYDANRQFHGASASSKTSIQQNGFDRNRKAGGATETVAHVAPQDFVDDAAKHNYLTSNKDIGKKYAVTGTERPSTLVRTMVDQQAVGLHSDPDSPADHLAVRTKHNIPRGNVLQSKKHGDHNLSGEANRHFQQQLRNNGVNVSEDLAKELLADAQSDSEDDDFTGVTPMGV